MENYTRDLLAHKIPFTPRKCRYLKSFFLLRTNLKFKFFAISLLRCNFTHCFESFFMLFCVLFSNFLFFCFFIFYGNNGNFHKRKLLFITSFIYSCIQDEKRGRTLVKVLNVKIFQKYTLKKKALIKMFQHIFLCKT